MKQWGWLSNEVVGACVAVTQIAEVEGEGIPGHYRILCALCAAVVTIISMEIEWSMIDGSHANIKYRHLSVGAILPTLKTKPILYVSVKTAEVLLSNTFAITSKGYGDGDGDDDDSPGLSECEVMVVWNYVKLY